MKKLFQKLFSTVAVSVIGFMALNAQTANVQVIHNCADPAAATVDVWVDLGAGQVPLLPGFDFREASPYTAVPSGATFDVFVKGPGSTAASPALATFTLGPLSADSNYIVVASGVVGTGFAANPNAIPIAFDLVAVPNTKTSAPAGTVNLAVYHGATDAPGVDVTVNGGGPLLVNNLRFKQTQGWLNVPAASYLLDLLVEDSSATVNTYVADLSAAGGAGVFVFASGFLNPATNNNGPAFGIFAALPNGTVIQLPVYTPPSGNANVQIIHNCADPAAATVDVWVDLGSGQVPLLPGFQFRQASAYTAVPAGATFDVFVKAPGSNAASPALANFTLGPLSSDSNYVVIASGVVGTGFAANPNSISTGFDLKIIANSKQTSPAGTTSLAVFHGATDAPGVDVRVRGGGPLLVNNLKYGDTQGWLTVPSSWYQLEVITEDSSAVVNTWIANLSGASGLGAVVFASGFLTPSANNNGAAFGLFAALPNGTVIELPVRQIARVQLVHNCPVPAASAVNVFVNGQLGFPNLAFRGATPFVDITANFPIQVGITPASSTNFADTLKTWLFFFQPNVNYVAMVVGAPGAGYAANPNGISTALDVVVRDNAVISNGNPAAVSFAVAHGATDAPTVDIRVRSGGPLLVNNASYKDVTGYLNVPPSYYQLEVISADSTVVVNTWIANLSALGGSGAFVFASGFLNPAANNGGPAFGLYAALPTGQVVAFPVRTTGNFQLLHNAADPSLDSVDVYVNGARFFDNFRFRSATPIIQGTLTAGVPIRIAVAPGNSTSEADTIWSTTLMFNTNQTYIAIANGVANPASFASNPDGKSTKFNVFIKTPALGQSTVASKFEFFAFHGATDAPTVDVAVQGGPTIVDNAAYGDMTPYIQVDADQYVLNLNNAAGTTTIKQYTANLTNAAGASGVVLASGFLDPSANQNGAAFGLYLVLPSGGGFIALPEFTSIVDLSAELGLVMFPNPASSTLNINFDSKEARNMDIQILDMNGRAVKNVLNGQVNPGMQSVSVNLNDLNSGLYFARVISNGSVATTKFNVVK